LLFKIDGQLIAAIEKMRDLDLAMSEYLNREMSSILFSFTEAFCGEALTLGYRSASLEARANRMMKRYLPSEIANLIELINKRMTAGGTCSVIRSPDSPADCKETDAMEARWRITIKDGLPGCECNDTSERGFPRSHLITIYNQLAIKTLPMA
jgi:hypothetical protein